MDADLGSFALVSAAHKVLPGEKLTIDLGLFYDGFEITDTMAYSPNANNNQVRIDAYDASALQYPSAASLKPAVFDATNITAGPFLGNVLSALEIQMFSNNWHTLTANLSPYVGRPSTLHTGLLMSWETTVGVLITSMSFARQAWASWNALCYTAKRMHASG